MNMNVRIGRSKSRYGDIKFNNSAQVSSAYQKYALADREVMVLIFLDAKASEIGTEIHTIGGVESAAVYPAEVFKSAIMKGAASIIMVHNHPSGDPEPSLADKEITRQMVYLGEALGIRVLDHVILGGPGRYVSLADLGVLDEAAGPAGQGFRNLIFKGV
jgi:DNA repair protein RadC